MRFSRRFVASASVLAAVLLVGTGCSSGTSAGSGTSSGSPSPAASAAPDSAAPTGTSPAPMQSTTGPASSSPVPTGAVVAPLSDAQWRQIVAAGVWRSGCPVGRAGLRRVELAYVGFDGRTHRGALVVNADVANSVVRIFRALYVARFPIHRMVPVEAYGGDDNASMAADNTSSFNCRRPGQANAPSAASPHANGRAIDVNPYENPWRDPRCSCFQPDAYYGTHRAGAGVVVKGGDAWRGFTAEGWIWQDSTTIDFQHFDTGYPSRPVA